MLYPEGSSLTVLAITGNVISSFRTPIQDYMCVACENLRNSQHKKKKKQQMLLNPVGVSLLSLLDDVKSGLFLAT